MTSACIELRRARPLLGTFVEVAVAAPTPALGHAAIDAAFAAVETVHRLMSFHDAGSDVSRLNRAGVDMAIAVHPWTYFVLAKAEEFRRASAGLFDVGVAPHLQSRGLLPQKPLSARSGEREGSNAQRWEGEVCIHEQGAWPTSPGSLPLATLSPLKGGEGGVALLPNHRVRLSPPHTGIDLGGIAKGFAVDRAIGVLRDHGIAHGIVNAGGDLGVFGVRHPVAVRDPRRAGAILAHIAVADRAVASSAIAASGAALSEIVDARSGQPANAAIGATVLAHDCLTADALTKLVMLRGCAAGPILAHYGASALFVSPAGEVQVSDGWPAELRHAA